MLNDIAGKNMSARKVNQHQRLCYAKDNANANNLANSILYLYELSTITLIARQLHYHI